MKIEKTQLDDVLILSPKIYKDARGYFYELYNQQVYSKPGLFPDQFVQDNINVSKQGVIRGLHYQIKHPQGKLIHVVEGTIFDVAVDLRKRSSTFGKWVSITLTQEENKLCWIPPGFAHGFYVLSAKATVLYKVTNKYSPQHERTILWNDSTLNINWPMNVPTPLLSLKDQAGQSFNDAEYYDE